MGDSEQNLIPIEAIAGRTLVLRGQRVLLDSDIAELFGVPTKVFNQAIKRNLNRFPADFMFPLSEQEVSSNRSQIVTGSQKHRDLRIAPYAFTEHGAIMAATILNSPRAVEASVYVVRAFVRMREMLYRQPDLAARVSELEVAVGVHDNAIRGIFDTLGQQKVLPGKK